MNDLDELIRDSVAAGLLIFGDDGLYLVNEKPESFNGIDPELVRFWAFMLRDDERERRKELEREVQLLKQENAQLRSQLSLGT